MLFRNVGGGGSPINTAICSLLIKCLCTRAGSSMCSWTGWLWINTAHWRTLVFLLHHVLNGCFLTLSTFEGYLQNVKLPRFKLEPDVISARSIRSLSWFPYFNCSMQLGAEIYWISTERSVINMLCLMCRLRLRDEYRKAEVTAGCVWDNGTTNTLCVFVFEMSHFALLRVIYLFLHWDHRIRFEATCSCCFCYFIRFYFCCF